MRLLQVARLSRSHDASTAIDKQDAKVKLYAEALGHEIVGTAVDKDVSGKTDPRTRPQLGAWLARPDEFDGIIASSLDRLARSTKWFSWLLEWAAEHGKTVITVDPAIDFSTHTGQLIGYIVSWLAEQELNLITARSKDTQDMLRANGYLVGRPMFGFRVVEKDNHKTLEPDPAEADAIRQAAERYLSGDSLRAVCAWLDGQCAPRGKGMWQPKSLSEVFRNPVLVGRRVNEAGKTVLKVPPILDMQTWRKLQAMMNAKASRTGVVPGHTAMLTGIAFCAKCDGPMYRVKSSTRRKDGSKHTLMYYRCHGTARNPSTCRNSIPLAELEEAVGAWVTEVRGHAPVVERVRIPGHGHEDDIAEAEQDIRELDLDSPDFDSRLAALRAERRRLLELPSEPDRLVERETGKTVAEHWVTLDAAGKRKWLLGEGITVQATRDHCQLWWVHRTGGYVTLAA